MQNFGYHNPYLGAIGQDEGDVSLAGPVILLLGLIGIGAALLFFKEHKKSEYYDDYEDASVKRVRNVIADIEDDEDFDEESEDFEEID